MALEDMSTGSGGRIESLRKKWEGFTQTSWRKPFFHPDVLRQYLFPLPRQTHLLQNLAVIEEGKVVSLNAPAFDIIDKVSGYSIKRERLPRLFLGKRQNISQRVRKGKIEAFVEDDANIANLGQSADPNTLPMIFGVTGLDLLISNLYDDKANHTRLFRRYTINGKDVEPLWDEADRAPLIQRGIRHRIERLEPGDTIGFSDDDGLTMNATILPLREGNSMSRFVLAVDKDLADDFKSVVDVATEKGLAIMWLVKKTQLGIMKSYLWQAAHGGIGQPAQVYIQSERGNRFAFDGTPIGGERFLRDSKPGVLDIIVEFHEGSLEEIRQRYEQDIKDKKLDPRLKGVAAIGIADNAQSGNSLRLSNMEIVLEMLQCPLSLVHFEYNPRQGLPSRANPSLEF